MPQALTPQKAMGKARKVLRVVGLRAPLAPNGDKSKGGERGRSATPGRGKGEQTKQPCYAFQKGACVKGKDCGYSHAKVKDRGRSATPKPGGKGQKVCAFHASGNCKFGIYCRDKHSTAAHLQEGRARTKETGKVERNLPPPRRPLRPQPPYCAPAFPERGRVA